MTQCGECLRRAELLEQAERILERKWRELKHLPQPAYNRLRQPAVDQLKQARENVEHHKRECEVVNG